MKKTLEKFKRMEIDKKTLYEEVDIKSLYTWDYDEILVRNSDVYCAIECVLSGKRSIQDLVDWTNIIWFTEVFDMIDEECDSIASVLDIFETLDEDGVTITNDELRAMQDALKKNIDYERKIQG